MSHRAAGLLIALAALAALGVAYWAQDFLHLNPCPLCLWERWPYRIAIGLGVIAAVVPRFVGRFVLALAALAMLADAAIAFIHTGVEFHWWQSPMPECNSNFTIGVSAIGFGGLPATPAKPCDDPTFLIPHLPVSMAAMDFIAAAAFALLLYAYLMNSRKQAA